MARHSLEDDLYYVTSITNMADRKDVVASEDIYAFNGHKLVSKSTVIRSELSDGLLKHKLLKPIDQSLIVKCGVTAESLAREAALITEKYPRMQQLVGHSGDAAALFQQLARLPLSPQMAFKLTVAKEQQPRLFHHLLLVTLLAQYLAVRGGLPERDMTGLLCAALFHDLV
jgi:HD-GYP domain-containing protein (c-di-GMP phosphodiesterase class II)